MNVKNIEQKNARNEIQIVWFHLYKAQNQAKLIYQESMKIYIKSYDWDDYKNNLYFKDFMYFTFSSPCSGTWANLHCDRSQPRKVLKWNLQYLWGSINPRGFWNT